MKVNILKVTYSEVMSRVTDKLSGLYNQSSGLNINYVDDTHIPLKELEASKTEKESSHSWMMVLEAELAYVLEKED